MLTGTLPFTATNPEELAHLHLEAKPIPPSEYIPDIPQALEEIILKVLSKEPSARYRTADQLGRVLMKFGTQRGTAESAPIPVTERSDPLPDFALDPTPRRARSLQSRTKSRSMSIGSPWGWACWRCWRSAG